MIMMMTKAPDRPAGDAVRKLATSLRQLILAGERFRNRRATELLLGPSDVAALGHLWHTGSLSPKELTALMGVTSGTMTALLDRVERSGFLRRERNPRDRRALIITITHAGQDAIEWLYTQFDAAIREALTGTSGIDTDEIQTVLEQLSRALEAETGQPVAARPTHSHPSPA